MYNGYVCLCVCVSVCVCVCWCPFQGYQQQVSHDFDISMQRSVLHYSCRAAGQAFIILVHLLTAGNRQPLQTHTQSTSLRTHTHAHTLTLYHAHYRVRINLCVLMDSSGSFSATLGCIFFFLNRCLPLLIGLFYQKGAVWGFKPQWHPLSSISSCLRSVKLLAVSRINFIHDVWRVITAQIPTFTCGGLCVFLWDFHLSCSFYGHRKKERKIFHHRRPR